MKSQNFRARESRTIIIIVSSCIDRCEHLQLRLKNLKLIKVKKPDENTNIQDLPIEVQGRVFLIVGICFFSLFFAYHHENPHLDKIMLTLNNLKDFEALSQVTPMFAEIAEEYEHVRYYYI